MMLLGIQAYDTNMECGIIEEDKMWNWWLNHILGLPFLFWTQAVWIIQKSPTFKYCNFGKISTNIFTFYQQPSKLDFYHSRGCISFKQLC